MVEEGEGRTSHTYHLEMVQWAPSSPESVASVDCGGLSAGRSYPQYCQGLDEVATVRGHCV